MTRRAAHAIVSLMVTAGLLGCGGSGRIGQPVVWPEPPDTARIRFVTAFSATAHLDRSGWSKFKRDLVGEQSASLQQPMGLALSEDGNRLYIADRGKAGIMIANFESKTLRKLATKVTFGDPLGVALDADENIYVTEAGRGRVTVLDRRGKLLRSFGEGRMARPTGIAIDKERKLVYVANTAGTKHSTKHGVGVYSLEGEHVRNLGPGGGKPSKGSEDGQFYFPTYLALDGAGNVYVADTMNFRVQVFSPEGKFLRKYGQNGTTPGTFARLKGLAFDSFDNLYVVDSMAAVVQIFNQKFELLMWFAGKAALLEYLQRPSCIAIDRTKNLIYICEQNIPRINVYELINTKAGDSFATPGGQADDAPGTSETPPAAGQ